MSGLEGPFYHKLIILFYIKTVHEEQRFSCLLDAPFRFHLSNNRKKLVLDNTQVAGVSSLSALTSLQIIARALVAPDGKAGESPRHVLGLGVACVLFQSGKRDAWRQPSRLDVDV